MEHDRDMEEVKIPAYERRHAAAERRMVMAVAARDSASDLAHKATARANLVHPSGKAANKIGAPR